MSTTETPNYASLDDQLIHLAAGPYGQMLPLCWGPSRLCPYERGRTTITTIPADVTCPTCTEWMHS